MLRCLRFVPFAVAFAAVTYADETTIPLDDGFIVVGADFHQTHEAAAKIVYTDSLVYELISHFKNQTTSRWRTVRLRFDFGATCGGKPKEWSIPITVSPLPYMKNHEYVETQSVYLSSNKAVTLGGRAAIPLPEDLTDCSVEIIKAVLLSAQSDERDKTTIAGTNTEVQDLSDQLRAIQARRDVEAVQKAKNAALRAERKKRLDAAEGGT